MTKEKEPFDWEEEHYKDYVYRIDRSVRLSIELAQNYSWIQRKVIKWFNIRPEQTYYLYLRAHFIGELPMIGDFLVGENMTPWRVISTDGDRWFTIHNIHPQGLTHLTGQVLALQARTYQESSRNV